LLTRVGTPLGVPQPLAVEQTGAGERHPPRGWISELFISPRAAAAAARLPAVARLRAVG
jgi:hypothetical protein